MDLHSSMVGVIYAEVRVGRHLVGSDAGNFPIFCFNFQLIGLLLFYFVCAKTNKGVQYQHWRASILLCFVSGFTLCAIASFFCVEFSISLVRK